MELSSIALTRRPHREDVLIARLIEFAGRDEEVAGRLRRLCEHDLPELNRHILSQVMHGLGTPEAFAASLHLIDDGKRPPVPQGIPPTPVLDHRFPHFEQVDQRRGQALLFVAVINVGRKPARSFWLFPRAFAPSLNLAVVFSGGEFLQRDEEPGSVGDRQRD